MTTLLELKGVGKFFGGLAAVNDVSLDIREGEIRGLIGPNGAGKTTLFNCVTGVYQADSGSVTFDGRSLMGLVPHKITRVGVARTFQQIRLFANMTALENVLVGLDSEETVGPLPVIFRWRHVAAKAKVAEEAAFKLLRYVGIQKYANEAAKNLAYGDQRRLEIARALATKPKLLLLDEPAAGMNPQEKAALMSLIRKIRDSGVTILLIEHDMKVVMGVCDRVAVLDHGIKIADGSPETVQRDPAVIEAYLGAGAADAS